MFPLKKEPEKKQVNQNRKSKLMPKTDHILTWKLSKELRISNIDKKYIMGSSLPVFRNLSKPVKEDATKNEEKNKFS